MLRVAKCLLHLNLCSNLKRELTHSKLLYAQINKYLLGFFLLPAQMDALPLPLLTPDHPLVQK